ncbi:MAG: YMGG-like glycine zipper-containing protein [Gemmatimonadaceae bacterium]
MRNVVKLLSIAGVAVLAACGGDSQRAMDESLRSDLSLATQMRPYGAPYMSPMEMGYAGQQPGYGNPQPYGYNPYGYPQPQYYPQPAPQQVVYRNVPVIQRVPSGGGGGGGGGAAPARTNTKQDAILGATAGAIIGATTSRDRLKGAVIGAAAGGLLGGIIGSTIHVQR